MLGTQERFGALAWDNLSPLPPAHSPPMLRARSDGTTAQTCWKHDVPAAASSHTMGSSTRGCRSATIWHLNVTARQRLPERSWDDLTIIDLSSSTSWSSSANSLKDSAAKRRELGSATGTFWQNPQRLAAVDEVIGMDSSPHNVKQ